jgi:ACT domain-containing protein
VRITEEELRKLTLIAIEELGENATPAAVKKVVERAVDKFPSAAGSVLPKSDKSSGRIILTSFGLDHPGIVARITQCLGDSGVDIRDMSQKTMEEFYTIIMIVDITNSPKDMREIQAEMNRVAEELRIKIYLQHEDLFQAMHRL